MMGVVNAYLGRLSKRMDQGIYREATVIGQDLLEALGRTGSLVCTTQWAIKGLNDPGACGGLPSFSLFSASWGRNRVGITCAHEPHQPPRP